MAIISNADAGPIWKRLLWMAALWLMSVVVLGTVAFAMRLWLGRP